VEKLHHRLRHEAVVALEAREEDQSVERGFVLEQKMTVLVYAVGELDRKKAFDYGWILNTKTRKKVWRFTYEDSQPAGGGDRNRLARTKLLLPAGEYVAGFVTDSSHTPDDWKTLPPVDPDFWGLTIWAPRGARPYRKRADYSDLPKDRAIIEITRVGNHQRHSLLFTISQRTLIRIYALGEGLPSGMADYGWIFDPAKHEKVWVMDYSRTTHAGGSPINRLADEVIELPAGTYVVGFKTDDAHAYHAWARKPPNRPERWGISLFAVNEDHDPDTVRRDWALRAPLAQLLRVRDDRNVSQRFTLKRDGLVAVRAIGESDHGKMADYGWIEHRDTGEVAWKMLFASTTHAGGARKNRISEGLVHLKAGEYVLYFKTDDSHAYGDWNGRPPADPEAWGISIKAAQ
jgi:hypothetical protein